MRMRRIWSLISLVLLTLIGQAAAEDGSSEVITVDPNQVVVQVYGIV